MIGRSWVNISINQRTIRAGIINSGGIFHIAPGQTGIGDRPRSDNGGISDRGGTGHGGKSRSRKLG